MNNNQGAYEKEWHFLKDMQKVQNEKDISQDEVKKYFNKLTGEYQTLLDEVRILIRQSDRQQARISAANQDLKIKSEELELASQKAEAARLRAESSEKFKEQFLANMSHEIRTPMNAVLGMTRLLLKTNLDEQQQKYLDAILQSSENLLVIINDILDLSKIEAGRMEFESIPFSLKQVCQGILDTLKFRVEEKGIELKLDMDPDMPEFLAGDPVRLSQVLLNLTGNAVKFTEKGAVTIRSQWKESSNGKPLMYVEVQDTGIGIPEDRQQVVFESYSQAGADTNRKFGGTGLGLTISKHLVEQQGGRIGLFSTLGKGTTFWFELPYEATVARDEHYSGEEGPEEIASRLSGVRILLVEDNPFNQLVAVDTLKELINDIKIEVAENGQEAIDYLSEHNVDIVLMDINMPVMDGFEATRLLRAREKNSSRHLAIMAMTAGVTKPELDACFEAGMDDVIGKPFDNTDLLNKIFQLRLKFASGIKSATMPKPAEVLAAKKILIVDDNPFNRMVAEDTLKSLLPDTIFEQAEDGADMLRMHALTPFEIILTDLNMPVMDGWQATIQMRKQDQNVRILAMTASNESSEREKCREIGMNGYVTKPFDADKLVSQLAFLVFQPDSNIFV